MATAPSAAGEKPSPAGGGTVLVWDVVVRLFHWTVVIGCLLELFVLEEGETAHQIVGYIIAIALVIRIGWGFIGTRHARFADFLPTPGRVIAYGSAMLKGREPRTLGHNPIGALMMLALMVLLAAVSVTGIMTTLDAFWGEAWLEELHEVLANLILGLAIVHAAGALYESGRHRENLVWSMITGRKRA
jgi:cytochrome b